MAKIKDNAFDQIKAERKRFLSRMKRKQVLADRIKRRKEREEAKKLDGSEKISMHDLL